MQLAVAARPGPGPVGAAGAAGAEETPGCSQGEAVGTPEKGPGWSSAATWVLLSQQGVTGGLQLLRPALRAATRREEGWEGAGTGWRSASPPRAPGTAGREVASHRSPDAWVTWVGGPGREQQEMAEYEKQETLAAFLLGGLEE